jgi:predicted ABC-type ATPase
MARFMASRVACDSFAIRRRFRLGWRNFEQIYCPLVDHWELYDNSGDAPILLGKGDKP